MDGYSPAEDIARGLDLRMDRVATVLKLLDEGATIPFLARYRKESTGGLDEVVLRAIQERAALLVELDKRRETILAELTKQGVHDEVLLASIRGCSHRAELEDLYLPYRPKRKTRASMARERGLLPLAKTMWSQERRTNPSTAGRPFVSPERGVASVEEALAGARDICAERLAELADARRLVRSVVDRNGTIHVKKTKEHKSERTRFDTYDGFQDRLSRLAGHRRLAIRRGEAEGVLKHSIQYDRDRTCRDLARFVPVHRGSAWAAELESMVLDALKRLLGPSCEAAVRASSEEQAEREAADVFAKNLESLLLAPPYGEHVVMGIDPGQRTGCKCVVIDGTGKLLDDFVVNLVKGDASVQSAKEAISSRCSRLRVAAVAVGNGTHGRETESFVRDLLKEKGHESVLCASVNEAGASIYSASDIAREEFPELDVSIRGAVSIARRFQDPLSELVKIDPESIGVGQYQHDISKTLLQTKLDEVVESCVNRVGVDVNTASAPLLRRVAGVGPALAKRVVEFRKRHGAFTSRTSLLKVSGFGPKAFEQAAGFLRVRGGADPLDRSAVHPERYELVVRMARSVGVTVDALIGDADVISRIDRRAFLSDDVGEFTFVDIMSELAKPGRDPRDSFEAPAFRDDVRTMDDLEEGMRLEGVVTNVTAFGAFVDVGVHQDGLVHVSQLADRFVRDPNEVVKVGDRLNVRVLAVDTTRKRISLSARSQS